MVGNCSQRVHTVYYTFIRHNAPISLFRFLVDLLYNLFLQLCNSWLAFDWHNASRGPSAAAELLVLAAGTLKLQDWTLTDDFAGVDIARLDNDGRMCGQLTEIKLQNFIPWEDFHSVSLSDTFDTACSTLLLIYCSVIFAIRNVSHPVHTCFSRMHRPSYYSERRR